MYNLALLSQEFSASRQHIGNRLLLLGSSGAGSIIQWGGIHHSVGRAPVLLRVVVTASGFGFLGFNLQVLYCVGLQSAGS